MVAVQRVPELVRQGAHAAEIVMPVHADVRHRVVRTAGEGAAALAEVRQDIDPAIGDALPDDPDVLLAHRGQRLEDEFDALLPADHRRVVAQGRVEIARVELIDAEQLPPDAKEART